MHPKQATLYNMDCIPGMQQMDPGSVSVVITSPPYDIGTKYSGGYKDTMPRQNYLDWVTVWIAQVYRVLEDGGSFFLNMGSKPSDPLIPYQVLNRALTLFTLQNTIHWVKSIAVARKCTQSEIVSGHYKPINSKRYLNDCHEFIFHLTKNGDVEVDRLAVGVSHQDQTNVKRWGKDKHCRGNTWFIPYETIQKRDLDRPHPAVFPLELPRMCMKLHGLSRITRVLDPFAGIGTTLEAAALLGVEGIGFEISKSYVDFAMKRCRWIVQPRNTKKGIDIGDSQNSDQGNEQAGLSEVQQRASNGNITTGQPLRPETCDERGEVPVHA